MAGDMTVSTIGWIEIKRNRKFWIPNFPRAVPKTSNPADSEYIIRIYQQFIDF